MRMVASKYGFELLNILFSLKCFLAFCAQAIHRLAIDKVSQLEFLFSGIGNFVFFKK